jgi:hypothetical protein
MDFTMAAVGNTVVVAPSCAPAQLLLDAVDDLSKLYFEQNMDRFNRILLLTGIPTSDQITARPGYYAPRQPADKNSTEDPNDSEPATI